MRRPMLATPQAAAPRAGQLLCLLVFLLCALVATTTGSSTSSPAQLSLHMMRRLAACVHLRITLAELDMESGARSVLSVLKVSSGDDNSPTHGGECLDLLGSICNHYGLRVCLGADVVVPASPVPCVNVASVRLNSILAHCCDAVLQYQSLSKIPLPPSTRA